MSNKIMSHEGREVRVICEGEGWSMIRLKGAMPFVVRSNELSQPTKRAVDAPKRCLCGDVATINDAWCESCFPDTGRN